MKPSAQINEAQCTVRYLWPEIETIYRVDQELLFAELAGADRTSWRVGDRDAEKVAFRLHCGSPAVADFGVLPLVRRFST